jgi:hypothetical protein
MPTIELPDGHSAEIRDPTDVRRGDVRAVAAAADKDMTLSGDQQGGRTQMQAVGAMLGTATMQDTVVLRFVKSWTLTDDDGRPLPVTLDVIQDLPLRYYNPLAAATLPALVAIQGGDQQIANGEPDPLSVARLSPSASTD